MHSRRFVEKYEPTFTPDQYTTLEELGQAMRRVVSDLPQLTKTPRVQVRKAISLEEMLTRLEARIEKEMRIRFSDLVPDAKEKTTVIVGFLAILESVKQGRVAASQSERYADIELERLGVWLPRY